MTRTAHCVVVRFRHSLSFSGLWMVQCLRPASPTRRMPCSIWLSANRRDLLIAPLLAAIPGALLDDRADASPIDLSAGRSLGRPHRAEGRSCTRNARYRNRGEGPGTGRARRLICKTVQAALDWAADFAERTCRWARFRHANPQFSDGQLVQLAPTISRNVCLSSRDLPDDLLPQCSDGELLLVAED